MVALCREIGVADHADLEGRFEAILARATVPILRQMEEWPPELVVALLPSLVRTMLTTFVEVVAEQRATKT